MSVKITLYDVINSIRNIPDFPKKGIMFKDITTALNKPEIFNFIVDEIYNYYKDKKITKVVAIESRGFIIGSALAYRLNAGFVPIRKPGKLPAETFSKSYSLEYGTGCLEIHKDALNENDVVLLHDDVLATGGSANAAIELINLFKVKNIKINFLIELSALNGINTLSQQHDPFSLIKI